MMRNKWVQASIIFGLAVGIWIGGWIALIWPMQPFHLIIPIPIGFWAMWIGSNARGTYGWKRPCKGPKK